MKRNLALAVLALVMGVSAIAQKTGLRLDVAIKREDVPVAVLTAFKSAYPQAKVRAYFREEAEGKLSYKFESMDRNVRRDILYDPDGNVVKIEERIAATDLPAEAQQAIHEKYPKAVVTTADKVTRGDQIAFVALVNHDKKRTRLEFDRNGKLTTASEVIIEVGIGRKIQ